MSRHHPPRHHSPTVESLEERSLPSIFAGYYNYNQVYYQAAVVRHEYDQYVSELKRLELASRATPSEYLALRNDARAIGLAASPGSMSPSVVQLKAVSTSLELDRAPLYGGFDDADWAEETNQLSSDLAGLNIPPSLVDQTIADMKALAVSAGVGPLDFATFTNDFSILRNGEQTLPSNSGYHFEDPSLYYTQHLRGFFRDWGVQKVEARGTLDRDLASIRRQSGTSPSGAAVLQRDASILESLGAAVPSPTMDAFNSTYVAAFAQGTPTPATLSQLKTSLIATLGPAATPSRVASVGRLVGDAPAFFAAAGSSLPNVQTIVNDVGTLVDAGGGETLNPFKVTIQPGRAPTD